MPSQPSFDELVINPDASFFSLNDQTYCFVPQTRSFASLNAEMHSLLQRLNSQDRHDVTKFGEEEIANLVDILLATGVLTTQQERASKADTQTAKRRRSRLTMFPTCDCNLRCTYCYAKSGETPSGQMSRRLCDQTIAAFFNNSRESEPIGDKQSFVHLSLHGGGEPTLHPTLLKYIHEAFSNKASAAGLTPKTSLVSNGTFNKDLGDWLLQNQIGVSFSLDGTADVQNRQRPFSSGDPTFDIVINNIRQFVGAGRSVAIRSTVTAGSIGNMRGLLRLADQEGIAAVHFEPVSLTGRAAENCETPSAEEFAQSILDCFIDGLERDIEVSYSGLRCFDHFHNRFCAACGDNICVTPEGNITTCYEVLNTQDPASEVFFVGHIDQEDGTMNLNSERIEFLRSRVTDNLHHCSDCLLRYNCAGDCLAKTFRASEGDIFKPDPYRCEISHTVNKRLIAWLADGIIEPRNAESIRVSEVRLSE